MNKNYAEILQESYLNLVDGYGEVLALEEIEKDVITKSLGIVELLNKVLDNRDNRFKVELMMFPKWSANVKLYRICCDSYTHIRIKKPLL